MDIIVPQDGIPYKRCSNPDCKNPWLPATPEYFYRNGKKGLYSRCKTCKSQYEKSYNLAHATQKSTYNKEYHQAHVQERRTYYKTYQRAHLGQYLAHNRNRLARQLKNGGTHTFQQIREQYTRQKGKCYYCQHKVEWGKHHVDHVIPLSRGGSNDISNLVIACAPCNINKRDKLLHEWPEGGRLL